MNNENVEIKFRVISSDEGFRCDRCGSIYYTALEATTCMAEPHPTPNPDFANCPRCCGYMYNELFGCIGRCRHEGKPCHNCKKPMDRPTDHVCDACKMGSFGENGAF